MAGGGEKIFILGANKTHKTHDSHFPDNYMGAANFDDERGDK